MLKQAGATTHLVDTPRNHLIEAIPQKTNKICFGAKTKLSSEYSSFLMLCPQYVEQQSIDQQINCAAIHIQNIYGLHISL